MSTSISTSTSDAPRDDAGLAIGEPSICITASVAVQPSQKSFVFVTRFCALLVGSASLAPAQWGNSLGCITSMSLPSYADPPFACPPDPVIGGMVIDLPRPISVNKLRRINWAAHKRAKAWRQNANSYLMLAKSQKLVRFDRVERFEITITFDEAKVMIDLDNTVKLLIDYLVDVGVIKNDAPQNMRKLTVQWGEAPAGTRISIKPLPATMKDVLQWAEARA